MRRLSLTFCWPMNSANRCGRSESSTTDSSLRLSGVVISARDIASHCVGNRRAAPCRAPTASNIPRRRTEVNAGRARSDERSQARETLGGILQRRLLFTEREPRERASIFLSREEARARHRGYADLLRHPL